MALEVINIGTAANDGTGDMLREAFRKARDNFAKFEQANGFASLDATGKLTASQIPDLALVNTSVVASQAAMLALTAQLGDVAIRTDTSSSYILAGTDPTVLANWVLLRFSNAVSSVAGRTGAVVLTAADISNASANGRSLIIASNYAAMKTLLAIAAADITDATSFGKSVMTAANAAAMPALGVPDYETGAFTPTLSFVTPGTSTFSYATQEGNFTRLGKMLYATLNLTFTPTLGGGAGHLVFSGLPYAVSNVNHAGGSVRYNNNRFTYPAGATVLSPFFDTGQTTAFKLVGNGSGVNGAFVTPSQMVDAAAHTIQLSVNYRAA